MKQSLHLGLIGLGGRGSFLLENLLLSMDDVEIAAVCDLYEDRREHAAEVVREGRGAALQGLCGLPSPPGRAGLGRRPHRLFLAGSCRHGRRRDAQRPLHRFRGGGAYSLEQCWQLVRAWEETGTPCMMLENCCYGRSEMMLLHMVRQGLFGELVHCQGGYEHDLREEVATGVVKRHYRFGQYTHRNGDLYPTHALGPLSKMLDINRGNRFVSLVSMASKSVGMREWTAQNPPEGNPLFTQGDVVTTMIRCARGETILLIHDTTPAPVLTRVPCGSRAAAAFTWRIRSPSISRGRRNMKNGIPSNRIGKPTNIPFGRAIWPKGCAGGHDGMDYLVLRSFVENAKAQAVPRSTFTMPPPGWPSPACPRNPSPWGGAGLLSGFHRREMDRRHGGRHGTVRPVIDPGRSEL